MKILKLALVVLLLDGIDAVGQTERIKVQSKKFKTSSGILIQGEQGYLAVPENRQDPHSRNIKIKFIRLQSLAADPAAPVIYLEGGGSPCTWQAEDPQYLQDWLPVLEVSDLIFIDQRGTTDKKLIYTWGGEYPEEFFVSEAAAAAHYKAFCRQALEHYRQKGIDVQGYDIVEHAEDVQQLSEALSIDQYSIFGFSFGTHIGMALMKLYEKNIVNAVLVSADGLDQSFNYPHYLDDHFQKIAQLASQNEEISEAIPNLQELLEKVMMKLANTPATVSIKNPLSGKRMNVKVGPFGLALILRLDIDDTNDIPILPRLLYTIDQGDYAMLQWFVQKRIAFVLALPGNGINQALASGASSDRWQKIEQQAKQSVFGNVVNFPFYDAYQVWPGDRLGLDTLQPYAVQARTLFVTGDLDCRTPVQQVNEIVKGFTNATHLVVKNAGHEQALWNRKIFDEAIPQFLRGKDVSHIEAAYKKIQFLPLKGPSDAHPSVR